MRNSEHLAEKNLAQLVLNKSALCASEAMDAFSNWLLAGFGAALALIIGNLSNVPIEIASVKSIVACFLGSATLAICGKAIGVIVRSGTGAGLEGSALAAKTCNSDDLNPAESLKEIEAAIHWPFRIFAKRTFRAAEGGDLARAARGMYNLVQWQSYALLGQASFFIAAIIFLYLGLPVV